MKRISSPPHSTLPTNSRPAFKLLGASLAMAWGLTACGTGSVGTGEQGASGGTQSPLEEGRELFRQGTLGMEGFWSGVAGLDTGLARAGFTTLDALSLGLQLDASAIDAGTLTQLTDEIAGGLSGATLDSLTDPSVFEALLGQGAVVGLVPVEADGVAGLALDGPDSLGISCALCHSVVDGSTYSGPELAGAIGQRVDGPAPADLRLGALFAYADRSSALYPYMTQSHATIGGTPIGRTEDFVEASSSEAEFDALLVDAAAFPAGLWDATPDGIGNPTVLPHVFEIRAAAPYGIAGEFRELMDALNAHVTLGLDPTTLLTSPGAQFMNRIGVGIGTEIVNEYQDVFAATGAMVPVGGLPFVDADATGIIGDELSPTGYRIETRDLAVLAMYLESLRAPAPPVGQAAARARGEIAFAQACATCHGTMTNFQANDMVSLLELIVPYAPTTLLARGFPFSDVLNDRLITYDDRLVIFDRLYSPVQVPGQARDYSAPNLRGLHLKDVFLHDGSVESLNALLDPARGAGSPHPYFVEPGVRADLIEFLVTR